MAISYAPVMPAGYFSRHSLDENGQPCISLHSEKVGWLSDHDCAADAIYAAQEREAAEAEEAADAEAVAVAMHVAREDVADAVRDFLHALDRGDFGTGHRFSDGSESAYVAALRQSIAPLQARP
jgi:hypothetical protein